MTVHPVPSAEQHRPRGTQRTRWSMALGAIIAIAGCRALPGNGLNVDRTGGVQLTMMVETPDDSIAYFRVERDGRLAFAGGRDAIQGEPSWTGDLRDEEIELLHERLERGGWFAPGFPDRSTIEPGSAGEIEYRVTLSSERGNVRFTLAGRHPAVTPVHDLLHEASLRRLEPILKTLPQPGEQRR